MNRDKSRLRQQLRQAEGSRSIHLQKILSERGPLRRGAFVVVQRKCGKPNCHCATGEGHPAKYLSVKEGGRTRMVYIPSHLEVRIAEEAERYRSFRQARAAMAKLARQSLELIDELERALRTTRKIAGKSRSSKKPSSRAKSSRKKG